MAKLNEITRRIFRLFKSKMFFILLIGLSIRVVLAPFTEQRYDMYVWRFNQVIAYEYNINPLSPPENIDRNATVFFWSYTPLWLFYLLAIYPIYTFFSTPTYPSNLNSLWQSMYIKVGDSIELNQSEAYHSLIPPNLPLLDLLIKLFPIATDILIGLFLFKAVKEFSKEENKDYKYLWIWLLNPYLIFISSIWGMFDSIPTFFVFLAVWLFLKRKYDKSAVCISVSALFKMYSIILSPILSLICWKKEKSLIAALKYLLISFGLTILVSFASCFLLAYIYRQDPFLRSMTYTWQLFKGRASPDWEGSNIFFGLTPLATLRIIFDLMGIQNNIPISPLLMGLAIVALLIKLHKQESLDKFDIVSYVIASHLIIYLTYSVVNEQYIVWILPFLLILSIKSKNSMFTYFYWTISLISILFIFTHYQDLSYFISPYFLPGYSKFLPSLVCFGLVSAVLYLIGIYFTLKK